MSVYSKRKYKTKFRKLYVYSKYILTVAHVTFINLGTVLYKILVDTI